MSEMTTPPPSPPTSHRATSTQIEQEPQATLATENSTKFDNVMAKAVRIGALGLAKLTNLASGAASFFTREASGDMEPSRRSVRSTTKGEVISQTYKHAGQTIITEKAARTDVVKILDKSLSDQRSYLLAQKRELDRNDPKMKELERKLEIVNRQLILVKTKSDAGTETWANSLYYRTLSTKVTADVGQFYEGFANLQQMRFLREDIQATTGNELSEQQQRLAQELLPNYKPKEGKTSLHKQLDTAIRWQQEMMIESPYAERLPKFGSSPDAKAPGALGDLNTSHTHLQATIHLYAELTGRTDRTIPLTREQKDLASKLLPGYSQTTEREALITQLQTAISERKAVVASKETSAQNLPACVNLRKQEVVEGTEGPVLSSINRSGAISDYHNGHTNLQEMESFRDEIASSPGNADELLTRGEKILPGFKREEGLRALAEQMDLAIVERTIVLDCQGLQDLAVHFEGLEELTGHEREAWLTHPTIDYTRYSMLNGVKDPKYDRGQTINEKNQMLDMAALYEKWEGATLIFDGKGPFRDEEGNIHLGVQVLDAKGQPAQKTLDVTYWNVSTTDNVENVPPQKEINQKAMEKLRKKLEGCRGDDTDWRNLNIRLQILDYQMKNEMPSAHAFDVLVEIASLTADLEKYANPEKPKFTSLMSTNCFSGKDRTGELAALLTKRAAESVARRSGWKGGEKAIERFVEYVGKQTMSTEGVFYGVIEDNVGHKAIKMFVRDNPLLRAKGPGKVSSFVTQLDAWKNALKLLAIERLSIGSRVKRPDQLS